MSQAEKMLGKYSVGVGDRFAHQARAQLRACQLALEAGVEVDPVWNKSNREHTIIGSEPGSVRAAADAAVRSLGWHHPYFCDADHITFDTVDRFLDSCDFYTIDVADYIGRSAQQESIDRFLRTHPGLSGAIDLEDLGEKLSIGIDKVRETASKFLFAVQQAGKVYRKIEAGKGRDGFVAEISMDETDRAQSPEEVLIILAAVAAEGIPIQTIAPKFSGRFNKGVDYVGDVDRFRHEMAADMAAIRYAVEHFGLPANLKLSIHSGSDKFGIYSAIHANMQRFDRGVHLKTAGTTWLEELIGLAEAGGDGLLMAKEIYAEAYSRREELCKPYASVIDIDPGALPSPEGVRGWTGEQFAAALRHDPRSPRYNSSLRQLLHVGFKVAAKKGDAYLSLLKSNESIIARNVTENLFGRHIAPVFLGRSAK